MGTSGVQSTDKEPETPVGSMSESQLPPFFTRVVLENVTLNEGGHVATNHGVGGGGSANAKKSRARFTVEEDKILIQAWLNVWKNATVGVDQKAESFWLRICDNYNKNRGRALHYRGMITLKSRWHRLNVIVEKFTWCYKQASQRKTRGSSESDIMADAYEVFNEDEGKQFNYEYAWRLLKDEPKWIAESFECSSKRTKISASGTYLSSNPSTPTSCEYDPASPTSVCPKAKPDETTSGIVDFDILKETIKSPTSVCPKAKPDETTSGNVDFDILQETIKSKMTIMSEFTRVKDDENKVEKEKVELEKEKLKFNEMQILLKDTSKMTERQLRDYEILCNMIREKYGMIEANVVT